MRWTGNGLADGTTLTTGNVNTPGNGDAVAHAGSGGSMVTAGDGFDLSGLAAGQVRRIDMAGTPDRAIVAQLFFTPSAIPGVEGANERVLNARSASANGTGLAFRTGGALGVEFGTAIDLGSVSPTLIAGHRYQVDFVTALATSPTVSNGRIFYRVTDTDDPGWNSGAPFFYDTGYAGNAGTADLSILRAGKLVNGTIVGTWRFEQLGWATTAVNPAHVSQAAAEAYFLPSPYESGSREYAFTWDGSGYVPVAFYRWDGTKYVPIDISGGL